MTEMMTITFQAELARVMTFPVTHEGTSRAYREIGISDGHHPYKHHQNKPHLMEKVARIDGENGIDLRSVPQKGDHGHFGKISLTGISTFSKAQDTDADGL